MRGRSIHANLQLTHFRVSTWKLRVANARTNLRFSIRKLLGASWKLSEDARAGVTASTTPAIIKDSMERADESDEADSGRLRSISTPVTAQAVSMQYGQTMAGTHASVSQQSGSSRSRLLATAPINIKSTMTEVSPQSRIAVPTGMRQEHTIEEHKRLTDQFAGTAVSILNFTTCVGLYPRIFR